MNQTGSALYIVESQTNRMQEFVDASYIRTFDFPDLGVFEPRGGAVDAADNVCMVNYSGGLVYRLAGDGSITQTFGSPGTGNGRCSGPYDAAIDGEANLFVVERGNNRIQMLDKHGAFVTAWGAFGAGNGELKQPLAIDLNRDGSVYLIDQAIHRVDTSTQCATRKTERATAR